MRFFPFGWATLFLLLFAACDEPWEKNQIEFVLNDSTRAVFPIQLLDSAWEIQNGGEVIRLNQFDTGAYRVPVFGGSIALGSSQPFRGFWTDSLRVSDHNSPYQVPVEISSQSARPISSSIDGTWDLWFDEADPESVSTAQLDLASTADGVQGTIRTPTGDYRYLSGSFVDGVLTLQTFDGAHLFYITGIWNPEGWTHGSFYSGNHYHVAWQGRAANPWPETESIRMLTVPLDSLIVRVIDRAGEVSQVPLVPTGELPLVVDVLGSWCPNCMDEVRLLREVVKPLGNDMVSVAFERPDSPLAAHKRIESFQREMGMEWDVYLGGQASKQIAADAFPFLDQIISFPTTLFIHSDGTVYVHSGFNGPATGTLYADEVSAFTRHLAPLTSLENR